MAYYSPHKKHQTVFQFKISLRHTSPQVWRRIQIPDDFTFEDLHLAIQKSIGWFNLHKHKFWINGKTIMYVFSNEDPTDYEPYLDEQSCFIKDHFRRMKQSALYLYDFEDRWEHDVVFETVEAAKPNKTYPLCLSGEEICPPENCGGPSGYNKLLDILSCPYPRNSEDRLQRQILKHMRPNFETETFSPVDLFEDWESYRNEYSFASFEEGIAIAKNMGGSKKVFPPINTFKNVYQFRITLKHTSPPIWRRIQVPENFSFLELHLAIQKSMGWSNQHMHEFRVTGKVISHICSILEENETIDLEESQILIKDYFKPNFKALYVYDLTDAWEHVVHMEEMEPAIEGMEYPTCLAGDRACPPEDCGGTYGYRNLLKILNNPKDPDFYDMSVWLDETQPNFHPDSFCPNHIFDDWEDYVSSSCCPCLEEPTPTVTEGKILQFKITLQGTSPKVWRRIQVPNEFTFEELHLAIQKSMGWSNYHLHKFDINRVTIAPAEDLDDENGENESVTLLEDFFTAPNKTGWYMYDYGDPWWHVVCLEEILPAKKGEQYPKCVDGEQACPPENCGGAEDYSRLMKVLANPNHREYKETKAWLRKMWPNFKPADFNATHVFCDWDHFLSVNNYHK